MKNILLLISFFSLFCLGIKTTEALSTVSVGEDGCNFVSEYVVPSAFLLEEGNDYLPMVDSPVGGAYSDMQLRFRRIYLSGRLLRQVYPQDILFTEEWKRKRAVMHESALLQEAAHYHSTNPRFNCRVASEHYIYGMRRILI